MNALKQKLFTGPNKNKQPPKLDKTYGQKIEISQSVKFLRIIIDNNE